MSGRGHSRQNDLHVAELTRCENCGSDRSEYDPARGEVVCRCGLVLESQMIDQSPPVLKLHEDGLTINLGRGLGLGSTFWATQRDARGSRLPERAQFKMFRMRRVQGRADARGARVRSERQAAAAILQVAARAQMPKFLVERAIEIGRRSAKTVRGTGFNIRAVALLSLAAKEQGLGSRGRVRELVALIPPTSHALSRAMGLRTRIKRDAGVALPYSDVSQLVEMYGSQLELPYEAIAAAKQEALRMEAREVNASPIVHAAAGLYVASIDAGTKRSQKKISKVLGVSEVSVRKRVRTYRPELFHRQQQSSWKKLEQMLAGEVAEARS